MANSRQTRKPPRPTSTVTAAQLSVLREFRSYCDLNGISPSLADLSHSLSISGPTVSGYLRRLTESGCLKATPARYRGWILTPRGRRLSGEQAPTEVAS